MGKLRSTRGVPWSTLTVDDDDIVVHRPFGRTWTFRRGDTTVRWHGARLVVRGHCVSLANPSLGEWFFTPIRHSVLLATLHRHGWPVDDAPPSRPAGEADADRRTVRRAGATRAVAVAHADDAVACREVIMSCALGWHSRWPGLRLYVSVLPEPLGFLRGVRKEKLKFARRERLHFDVFPGEILEFRLDSPLGGVMDVSGASAVTIPSDAAGRTAEISIQKPGYVLVYGRFRASVDVRD